MIHSLLVVTIWSLLNALQIVQTSSSRLRFAVTTVWSTAPLFPFVGSRMDVYSCAYRVVDVKYVLAMLAAFLRARAGRPLNGSSTQRYIASMRTTVARFYEYCMFATLSQPVRDLCSARIKWPMSSTEKRSDICPLYARWSAATQRQPI